MRLFFCALMATIAFHAGRIAQEQERPRLPTDSLPADLATRAIPEGLGADFGEASPASAKVIALGRKLFFDGILSVDRTVSCASCHDPAYGFASPEVLPLGVHGRRATRHAPTLFNRAWGTSQFWDGRVATLEEQVLQPIANPLEMDLEVEQAVKRLREDEAWSAAFTDAFDAAPSAELLGRALAAFLRRIVHGGTPIDRFRAAKGEVLTPSERAGLWIYESKGRCWRCHDGANFSDEDFHNTGVSVGADVPDLGREIVTGRSEDRGRFKTPTLRGVALTAPYMHDGSMKTLAEVIEFYRRGGNANDNLDPLMKPLDLSDADVHHLVAFLEALSRGE